MWSGVWGESSQSQERWHGKISLNAKGERSKTGWAAGVWWSSSVWHLLHPAVYGVPSTALDVILLAGAGAGAGRLVSYSTPSIIRALRLRLVPSKTLELPHGCCW